MMKGEIFHTTGQYILNDGMKILGYWKNSKQNESNEWIEEVDQNADEYIITRANENEKDLPWKVDTKIS